MAIKYLVTEHGAVQEFDNHSEAVDVFRAHKERLQSCSDRNELDGGSVELSIVLDQFNVGGE